MSKIAFHGQITNNVFSDIYNLLGIFLCKKELDHTITEYLLIESERCGGNAS
jgi:hypothetical protein